VKTVIPVAKIAKDFENNEEDLNEQEEEKLKETKYHSIVDLKGVASPKFEQAGFNETFNQIDKKRDVSFAPLKRVISEMPKNILSSDLNQFIEEPVGKLILFYFHLDTYQKRERNMKYAFHQMVSDMGISSSSNKHNNAGSVSNGDDSFTSHKSDSYTED
jgi:hypothetical protein